MCRGDGFSPLSLREEEKTCVGSCRGGPAPKTRHVDTCGRRGRSRSGTRSGTDPARAARSGTDYLLSSVVSPTHPGTNAGARECLLSAPRPPRVGCASPRSWRSSSVLRTRPGSSFPARPVPWSRLSGGERLFHVEQGRGNWWPGSGGNARATGAMQSSCQLVVASCVPVVVVCKRRAKC